MTPNQGAPQLTLLAGRYVIGETIGRGGAATVHLGKPSGEGRRGVVAIKRLHPHLAADPAFLAMMLDEARLLSRVRHPNVVATLDVVLQGGELYIVMDYVHGATLGALLAAAHRKRTRAPAPVACAIARDALLGLHAAHEATGPAGEPLGMVHRDVSPQNLLVAEDGVLKVVDFGIAKAEGRVQQTEDGSIKGKLGYMPPEQLFGDALDRRADVYAMGVVLWETLVGQRLFAGENDAPALVKSLVAQVDPPSDRVTGIAKALDKVVMKALAHGRDLRFQTAREMADAIGEATAPAKAAEVGAWVRSLVGDTLDERGARLFVFDRAARDLMADTRARETMMSIGGGATNRRRTWAFAAAAAVCAALGGSAAVLFGAPPSSTAAGTSGSGAGASAQGASSSSDAATSADPTTTSANDAATSAATGSNGGDPLVAAPSTAMDAPGANGAMGAPGASATDAPGANAATGAPGANAAGAGSQAATSAVTGAKSASDAPRAPSTARTAPTIVQKTAPKPDGCDPPFTIDAQGHKRYKRECLR